MCCRFGSGQFLDFTEDGLESLVHGVILAQRPARPESVRQRHAIATAPRRSATSAIRARSQASAGSASVRVSHIISTMAEPMSSGSGRMVRPQRDTGGERKAAREDDREIAVAARGAGP